MPTAHHGSRFYTFVAPETTETALILHGLTDDMPFADIHHGAYAVPTVRQGPGSDITITFHCELNSEVAGWLQVYAQWYRWDGSALVEMTKDPIGKVWAYGGVGSDWTQVDVTVFPAEEATHWKPIYRFFRSDPRTDDGSLLSPPTITVLAEHDFSVYANGQVVEDPAPLADGSTGGADASISAEMVEMAGHGRVMKIPPSESSTGYRYSPAVAPASPAVARADFLFETYSTASAGLSGGPILYVDVAASEAAGVRSGYGLSVNLNASGQLLFENGGFSDAANLSTSDFYAFDRPPDGVWYTAQIEWDEDLVTFTLLDEGGLVLEQFASTIHPTRVVLWDLWSAPYFSESAGAGLRRYIDNVSLKMVEPGTPMGTSLPEGTEVYIDSIYIPDNGLSVKDEPYLDGDQSYGIWEGEKRRSSSIFGTKPPADVVIGPPLVVGPPPDVPSAGRREPILVTPTTSVQQFIGVPDLPAATQPGDLAVCFIMDGSGTGPPSDLNGYTLHGSTGPVSGNTYGGWTNTNVQMHILSKVVSGVDDKFGGTTPSPGSWSPIGCWVILRDAEIAGVATDTEPVAVSSAITPLASVTTGLQLRVWAALMASAIYQPGYSSEVNLVARSNWTNADMVVVKGTEPGEEQVSTSALATQWMTATVAIRGTVE